MVARVEVRGSWRSGIVLEGNQTEKETILCKFKFKSSNSSFSEIQFKLKFRFSNSKNEKIIYSAVQVQVLEFKCVSGKGNNPFSNSSVFPEKETIRKLCTSSVCQPKIRNTQCRPGAGSKA